MADTEGEQEPLQRDRPAALDGGKQFVGGFLAKALLVFQTLGTAGIAGGQREDVGGAHDAALGIEQLDPFIAEAFDVEGVAGDEVFQPLLGLGGANQPARAAAHDICFARSLVHFALSGTATDRALTRKNIGDAAGRALVLDDADHLGDDVAGALHHDGIADADVLAGDLVLVVERGVRDHHAADRDGLEFRDRRQRAGAADLDLDGLQDGHGLLSGELVGDGPARRARHEPEPDLIGQRVHLVDDAVDVVAEAGANGGDLAIEGEHLIGRAAQPGARVYRQSPVAVGLDHAELAVGGQRRHLAPAVGEEPQRAGCRDAWIELAQRSGGRVARVGEELFAGALLCRVEGGKLGMAHVDLATDADQFGHPVAAKLPWHVGDGHHIGGDVLAFRAVAPRGRRDQHAVLVAQGYREAVDLGFGGDGNFGRTQKAGDPVRELVNVVICESVAERQHGHRVAHLAEAIGRRGADPLRRTIGANQIRKARLDGVQPGAQDVVVGV